MNARCVYPLVVLLLAVAGLPICVRAATQSDPVVDPSLVGWWTFDDTDSGLIADACGWGRDGI